MSSAQLKQFCARRGFTYLTLAPKYRAVVNQPGGLSDKELRAALRLALKRSVLLRLW